MTNYGLVTAESSEELATKVLEAMRDGWQPQGGVAVIYTTWTNARKGYEEGAYKFVQAMVKP